jgi:predicted DNA-binding transcriptional regulator AlpA
MNNSIKKKYRAREVSELLSIGLSTVWLYAKQGKLTPIKLSPRVTVFDIKEIEALANGEVSLESPLLYRIIWCSKTYCTMWMFADIVIK